MNKKVVMVLLIGLCVLGGLFAQGGREDAKVMITTNAFPYEVVVNKALVPDMPATVADIVDGSYWGEILVPASLKAELVAYDPAFGRDALYADDAASVVDAVAVQEFAIGIVPSGTEIEEAAKALLATPVLIGR